VLTSGGKPFAIALGIEEDEVEEVMALVHRLRALRAVARMQRHADERGLDAMSEDEIEQEIREARRARRVSG
jgi:hypothetical protein